MIFQGLIGLVVLVGIAWVLSENKKQIHWPTIAIGILLQWVLAIILLRFPIVHTLFLWFNHMVVALQEATGEGTRFVFGYLGGGPLPFQETKPGGAFVLAFQALPLILVISALSSLLYYWRILPWIVGLLSKGLKKSLGVGGVLALGATMNIFVGMVEAPLLIRPYLSKMTRSELFSLMSCGMATIAGTMMILYASLLGSVIPNAIGHILTASIISAPAALIISLLMIPETKTATDGSHIPPSEATSSMDAVTRGTTEGISLMIQVVAMLVVLVALVSLVNQLLGLLPDVNGQPLALQRILGFFLAPLAWVMGIPWSEAPAAGTLLATKTVLNEFVAYLDMAHLPEGTLSQKSQLIMTYALCGFANLGSLGIMIGGMGSMAPERRSEIIQLGPRSILAGTLATCMTGTVVGLIF